LCRVCGFGGGFAHLKAPPRAAAAAAAAAAAGGGGDGGFVLRLL